MRSNNLFILKWSPAFLTKTNIAMLPILFVILWMYTGMYLILFLANMQKIDVQIVESARIDGANEGQGYAIYHFTCIIGDKS